MPHNTAVALIACDTPCNVISSAKTGISVFSRNTTGKPLVSAEYVKTNWFTGYDKRGQPVPNPEKMPQIAGALVSPILPFQPPTGLSLSVTSFNIVIIGGMGSLLGAFTGGLLVSVAEALGAVFLRPSLKELFSFSLLIVILLFRPAGLFGKRTP